MSDPYTRQPATADYGLREGDTGPALEATLTDLDGSAVDLSTATEVRLYIRRQADNEDVVNTAITIDDAATGQVSHEFTGGFSTTGAGMHELYFRVEFDSGAIETYPRMGVAYLWVPDTFAQTGTADLDPDDAEVGVLTADSLRSTDIGGRDGNPLAWTSAQDAQNNDLQNVGAFDGSKVTTDELSTSARLADIVVHQPNTDWVANGDDGQIASGSDAGTVLQAAIDSLDDDDGMVWAHNLDPSSVTVTLDRRETVVYAFNGNQWFQTYGNDGVRFWGTGEDGDYMGIKWYPEQRGTDGTQADATITAHKKKDDGTVDEHLSIYTGDGAGSENKRLDVPYGAANVEPHWQNITRMIFDGALEPRTSTPVAGTGAIRLASGEGIATRNSAGDDDLFYLTSFADDKIRIGDTNNAGLQLWTGGGVEFHGNLLVRGNSIEDAQGIHQQQRGDPSTSELASGEVMTFASDGSGTGSAGDLVYAVNDGGTIKTSVIAQVSNAT